MATFLVDLSGSPSLAPAAVRSVTMGFEIQEPLQPFMVRSRRVITRAAPILRRTPAPPSRVGTPVVVGFHFRFPPRTESRVAFPTQGRKERRRSSAGKLFLGGKRA